MNCPFYLAIAFFTNKDLTWTEECTVNSEEIDVNNKEELIRSFSKDSMEREHLVKLLVVANSTESDGPYIIGDWG